MASKGLTRASAGKQDGPEGHRTHTPMLGLLLQACDTQTKCYSLLGLSDSGSSACLLGFWLVASVTLSP